MYVQVFVCTYEVSGDLRQQAMEIPDLSLTTMDSGKMVDYAMSDQHSLGST